MSPFSRLILILLTGNYRCLNLKKHSTITTSFDPFISTNYHIQNHVGKNVIKLIRDWVLKIKILKKNTLLVSLHVLVYTTYLTQVTL